MSYLAARDQMIDAIQNQINERKAMLLENHKNIQQTAKWGHTPSFKRIFCSWLKKVSLGGFHNL